MPDEPRHDVPDTPRPAATEYSLTLEDVSRLFNEAGLDRDKRTLQRYCAAGRLDCIKEETVSGLTYFVESCFRRARDQAARATSRPDRRSATSRDTGGYVAPCRSRCGAIADARHAAPERGRPRQWHRDNSGATERARARHVGLGRSARKRERAPCASRRIFTATRSK